MTSIQQWENRTEVALAGPQDVAVQRLAEWATSADAAYQVAERLSQSAFVPAQFKGKPVELTAAILSGLEVGLSPMAAMRAFDIIQGQAAPRAITLRAVVQSHGHEMTLIESTNSRCRMKGRRRGSEDWQTVTWTIDRARDLQLTGKDNWKKQPGAMLLARATSELARLIASDAILGIGYSAEEVADGGGGETVTTTPAEQPTTRRMSRPMTSDPDPVSGNTAESPDASYPSGEDEQSGSESAVQMLDPRSNLGKRMFATINDAGITEAERLPYIASVIGREIASSKDMTQDEASAVIDALTDVLAEPFGADQ